MFSRTTSLTNYTTQDLMIWMTLAFQAGALNVGGFMACGRFVSHTTGFATHFGAELAQGDIVGAWGMFLVPSFFILGAMTSALFVDRQVTRGHAPHHSSVLGIIALIMLVLSYFAIDGYFGAFKQTLYYTQDYVLLITLCYTAGLQNALVSSASGSVVRTTHMTGYTTDLGISLVRLLSQHHRDSRRSEIKAFTVRAMMIGAFIFGSFIAGFVFIRFHFYGFILPTSTAVSLWLVSLYKKFNKKERKHHD